MKKIIRRIIPILVITMFFMSSINIKTTNAAIDRSDDEVEWDFKITQVGDAERWYYSYDDKFTFLAKNMQIAKFSGKTYNINTKEVAIQVELVNQATDMYISVDDKYIGKSNDNLIDYSGDIYTNFTVVTIKNLTPGKHTIEIKADPPYHMGVVPQKTDYLYVNIPVVEDEQINKSIENINSGTADLYDFVVVGVDGINQDNLNKVNEMTLGKNFDASNVQASVTEMLNQINSEIKLKDAFTRINSGVGILSDYTTIGVINVTSSNLNGVNALVKSKRDIKNVDLTKDEIQGLVDNLPNMIDDANTRISEGTSTLVDYVLVGITGITDINLADVNEYVKGKDNSTKSKLQTNVTTIVNALSYINNGTTSLSYYTTLGITTVTADNSSVVKQNILTVKNTKGNNLTKAEIKKVVEDSLENITDAYTRINAGTATLDDYTNASVTGVTDINLADVNEYVKGKDNSTKSKLQTNITTIVNALSYINNGTTSLSYYTTLGITTVTTDNSSVVKQNILAAKSVKGINLTKTEIKKVVEDSLINIADSYTRINAGTATLVDYTLVAVTGVTDINLADVNEYVKGRDNSTKSKLQTNATTIVNALSYINNGTTSLSYYTTLGITTVTADNSSIVKQNILAAKNVKGTNLTKAEIKKVVEDSLVNIADSYTRINAGTATVEDYTGVGVTGVSGTNLADVNEYVKGKDNSTKSKMQTNVTAIVNALSYINQGTAVLSYYPTLGITTVTADNVSVISKNIVAAKAAKGNNLTKAEIKKVVEDSIGNIADSYTRINAGTATVEDYTLVGVKGVTDINLADVNEYVKGKDNSTKSKLQANVTAIVDALYHINYGNAGVSTYTTLGITTVTSDNFTVMNKKVVAAKNAKGINLTKAEIKKVVEDSLVNIADAYTRINAGTATLTDYTLLEITGVTDINLADVNEYIKEKDNSTKRKLQTNVTTIVNALSYINNGTTSLSYYTTLGVTAVTADNSSIISKNVVAAKNIKGSNLTKAEIKKVVEDSLESVAVANAKINAGTATLTDYTLLGITGVTDINLADVNEYVKGKDNSTKRKLQTNVTTIVNALSYINNGTTSLSYYTTLGITTVTVNNISIISKNIVVAKNAKGTNLTKAEILKVVGDSLKVNTTQNVVISKQSVTVTTNLIETQQAEVDNVKTEDIQKEKDETRESLEKINLGQATLEDYEVIGILSVTDENLEDINNEIKLAKDSKGSNLMKAKIIELVQEFINKTNDSKETEKLTDSIEEKVKIDENNYNKQDESSGESETEILDEQTLNKEESINETKSSELTSETKEVEKLS